MRVHVRTRVINYVLHYVQQGTVPSDDSTQNRAPCAASVKTMYETCTHYTRSQVVLSLPSAASALLRFNLSLLFCRKGKAPLQTPFSTSTQATDTIASPCECEIHSTNTP